jgi:hypothetical protein
VTPEEGKKEAVKTYIEQTKLLVTLSSAFLFAPVGLIAILKDRAAASLTANQLRWFVVAQICFIMSVVAGYFVLATISGWQHLGQFDVHRPATRWGSLVQFSFYLAGLIVFVLLAKALIH